MVTKSFPKKNDKDKTRKKKEKKTKKTFKKSFQKKKLIWQCWGLVKLNVKIQKMKFKQKKYPYKIFIKINIDNNFSKNNQSINSNFFTFLYSLTQK